MYEALANTFPESQTAVENDRSSGMRVHVFPNPVNAIMQVHADGPFTAELYTLSGKLLKRVPAAYDALEIDLGSEQAGIYILKVTGEHGISTTRLMHY
jgi:hypothetical protein